MMSDSKINRDVIDTIIKKCNDVFLRVEYTGLGGCYLKHSGCEGGNLENTIIKFEMSDSMIYIHEFPEAKIIKITLSDPNALDKAAASIMAIIIKRKELVALCKALTSY